jgi:outer membrane receptor for ferrienterochelin and colicin
MRNEQAITHHVGQFAAVMTLVCAAHFAASGVFAQGVAIGDMSLEDLMNVRVTTATRTSERARDVPARIEVVTADQIEQRGYRSLTDVLDDLPHFKVERGADQDLPVDIVVQGTRGSLRIVLLLDGIRISSPTGEPLPILANYPVHTARQIEVVYGPGSALYGADAFSAVINIISKDASETEGLTITQSIGQFGLSNTAASYGVQLGRARLLVATQVVSDRQPNLPRYYPADFGTFDAQRRGTFDTIFGSVRPNGTVPGEYANPLLAHSVQATLHAGALQLTFFKSGSKAPTSPAYTPDNAVYSDEAFNLNNLLVGAASYTRRFGGATGTTMVTLSRHELDPQSGYRNVYSNMDRSYKYAYGSMIKAEQQFSWKIGDKLTATVGGAAEHYFAIPQGADLNAPIRSHDEPGTILGTNIRDDFFKIRYENFGGYVQTQYAVHPRVMLTLGVRGDENTRYGGTVNPRAGIVWQPNTISTVKLMHGSAFLAPSPYQQYSHYGSFYSTDDGETYASDFWHLANPDLKPQRKSTTELAARRAIGLNAEVWSSVFYSSFSDLIRESVDREDRYAGVYKGWPVGLIEVSINEGNLRTYGGGAGIDVVRPLGTNGQITSRASLSLADGRTADAAEQVEAGGMAPVQIQMSSDVRWNAWSISPRVSFVGRQRLLAAMADSAGRMRRRTLDGYALLNMNVRRNNVFKNVDAFVTIENALDRRYRSINLRAFNNPEELIGAPQNPRRVTVGLQVRLR